MNETFPFDDDAQLLERDTPAHEPGPGGGAVGEAETAAPADQPVPRIAIRAFCELPETAQMISSAAKDRRMSRAHVQIEMGGFSAAVERFRTEATPNLVIVETGLRGRALFDQLEDLASVCDTETKVVLIGAANDIGLYRELMRRGLSEYLVPPVTTAHLMRTIAGLYLDPSQPYAGRTIAFIGAKGGSGSSTIAHNTAWSIAEHGRLDTTIVDLDLPFGTASLDFNQEVAIGVADALAQPDRVDPVLLDRLVTRCTERLTLFAAPGSIDRDWDLSPDAYETVVEAIRRTVPAVVLDLPHIWSPWIKRLLYASDEVVITTTPELAGLRNAKGLYDMLKAARPNDAPPRVVLNMVGVVKRPEIPVKDFGDALGAAPDLVLPFDPALFGSAANNGQMLAEVKADAKCAEGVRHLATLVTGRQTTQRRPAMLQRFLKRK